VLQVVGDFDTVGAITVYAFCHVSGYVHSSAGVVTVSPLGSVFKIMPA
jgi:hypothetical protein